MARSKKTVESTPNVNYGLMLTLSLFVQFTNSEGDVTGSKTLDTVAFVPNDLPLLEALRAEVVPGSRRVFTPSKPKVEKLYTAVVSFKDSVPYGSAAWMAAKSCQVAMNSLHAYAKKAGENCSYRLVANSNQS